MQLQRGYIVIGSCIVAAALCFINLIYGGPFKIYSKPTQNPFPQHRILQFQKKIHLAVENYKTDFGTKTLTVCPGDVIPEEIALLFPPCQDHKTASDAKASTIYASNGKDTYTIGEAIHVQIVMYDGYGKRQSVGGDHLRARLISPAKQAAVNGHVVDHENGTYTAIFEALWTGKAEISASLVYTREMISAIYRVRKELMGTRVITAQFSNPSYKEQTLCHTFKEKLKGYAEVCNLTYENSGMPWYCGKPKNQVLLCEDWKHVGIAFPYPELPVTDAEQKLFERGPIEIQKKVNIEISKGNQGLSSDDIIPPPEITCSKYNRTNLWHRREPTGFMYKNQWHIRHCKGFTLTGLKQCLMNTTLILFGDSTTRQWFKDIQSRLDCKMVTESWAKSKWHKRSICINKNLSFRVEWVPHSQPFFIGSTFDDNKYSTRSISRGLDELDDESRVFVLIHMFMHVAAFHHSVLETKMKKIRDSVEKLVARNKFVKVLIKAPHTFKDTPAGPVRLSDYTGFIYRNIMFHVFKGLHDKIVYLDNKDITVSLDITPNHPPDNVVTAMVDAMFSYACN